MRSAAVIGDEAFDPRLLGVELTASEAALLECELAVLHELTRAKLFALGIQGSALSGRDTFDALHVEPVCFLPGKSFEFARYLRDATSAMLAVVIPARDERRDGRPCRLASGYEYAEDVARRGGHARRG